MVKRLQIKPTPNDADDIDLKEAAEFLELLGEGPYTFQTFDDNPDRKDGRLARILHGRLEEHANKLCDLNRRGAGVFVALNKTDGKGRQRENIIAVRANSLDLDGSPLAPVRRGLRPHIIVESSPGKYHVYWLVTDEELNEFEDIQRAIAKRFDGDPAVALLTHCARLPGFFHKKAEPFRTRIEDWAAHDAYSSDRILEEFPPEKKPHRTSGSVVVLPAGVPVECGRQFVRARFFAEEALCLHYYRGGFYAWRRTHFKQRDPEYVRAELYVFLNRAFAKTEKGIVPFNPTAAKVNTILDAVRAGCYLDSEQDAPCWLSGEHPPPEQLIACRNGLLDLTTFELTPHSPHFFNVNALNFDYEANAPRPERWEKFLSELWPEDEEAWQTLQEIFGLLLTSDTSYQKIFMLVGPKRSGKGTVGHVLTMLLGRANVTSPTMASLGTQFGLWPLIDRRLAIVPDARLAVGPEGRKSVEHLLSVSGEDSLTIDRKYQEQWTGKLSARFLILTNELPKFSDASGALASRFVILTLQRSFYGKEELDLKEKLRAELPGILNWALNGLRRLRKRGHFAIPQSSLDAIQQMEDLSSPVSAFVRDKCDVGPNRRIEKSKLYGVWKSYCEDQGEKPGSARVFGRNLTAAFPAVRPGHSGDTKLYLGIELKENDYRDTDDDSYRARRRQREGKRWRDARRDGGDGGSDDD